MQNIKYEFSGKLNKFVLEEKPTFGNFLMKNNFFNFLNLTSFRWDKKTF
jgi:hypothetical protein